MDKNKEIVVAIKKYLDSLEELKKLGVLKNQKDFTSQVGEWISSIIYRGELAKCGKQVDWDLKSDNILFQIKTHAKSTTSKRRDTGFKYNAASKIDYLVIIVFNQNYKLENIFKISLKEALNFVNKSNIDSVIKWSDLKTKYSENLEEIYKNNEILKIFKN